MKNEYIIINRTSIEKRIEELRGYKDEPEITQLKIYKEILAHSILLTPEIEKAHNVGTNYGVYLQGGSYDNNDNIDSEDYISNLKLDI